MRYQCFLLFLSDNSRVLFSVVMAATGVSQIAPHTVAFTKASSAAEELFKTIDRPSEIDPLSPAGHRPSKTHGTIELRDVFFCYPSRESYQVLRGLNLAIPAGKTTALVGPSGCGKSTIIGLLERWYNPSDGCIYFDGYDISELNIQWLRSQIRLVQQVSFIHSIFSYGLRLTTS